MKIYDAIKVSGTIQEEVGGESLIFTIQMGNRNPGDNRDNLTGLLPASLHVRAQRGKMASLARSLHSLEHTMGAEKRDKGRQGESFEP
jgi:hypothetical protein